MQRIIIIAGLPGTGKSTLAEGLSRKLSLPLFSIDPIETATWRGGMAEDSTGKAAYEAAAAVTNE
jgi:adenylate kinase family enzyme